MECQYCHRRRSLSGKRFSAKSLAMHERECSQGPNGEALRVRRALLERRDRVEWEPWPGGRIFLDGWQVTLDEETAFIEKGIYPARLSNEEPISDEAFWARTLQEVSCA